MHPAAASAPPQAAETVIAAGTVFNADRQSGQPLSLYGNFRMVVDEATQYRVRLRIEPAAGGFIDATVTSLEPEQIVMQWTLTDTRGQQDPTYWRQTYAGQFTLHAVSATADRIFAWSRVTHANDGNPLGEQWREQVGDWSLLAFEAPGAITAMVSSVRPTMPLDVVESGAAFLLDDAGNAVYEIGPYEIRMDPANPGGAQIRIRGTEARFDGSIDEPRGGFHWSSYDSNERHLTSGSFTYDGGVFRSAVGGVDGDWVIRYDCQGGPCREFPSPARHRARLVAASSRLPATGPATGPAPTGGSACDQACRNFCTGQGFSGGVFNPNSGAVCLIGQIQGSPAQACACS